MRPDDYTADTICRAMGLSGFIENSWSQLNIPTLRVVLMPSFYPEISITLSRMDDRITVSVIALTRQLWGQESEIQLPHEHEEISLPISVFEELIDLFRTALLKFERDLKYACCDGMSSESCLVSQAETHNLRAHVSEQPASARFIARLTDLAWLGCQTPRVRNALACAGRYLGMKYPMQDVPPETQVTRLAVLGAPEEKSTYLDMLRQRRITRS